MQSLGLDVEVLSEEGKEVKVETEQDEIMRTVEEMGIDIVGSEGLEIEEEEETEEEFLEEEELREVDNFESEINLKEEI
jgi:hypothetical protein